MDTRSKILLQAWSNSVEEGFPGYYKTNEKNYESHRAANDSSQSLGQYTDEIDMINIYDLCTDGRREDKLGRNNITGQDVIDFIEFRRRQAQGAAFDVEFMAAALGKPKA